MKIKKLRLPPIAAAERRDGTSSHNIPGCEQSGGKGGTLRSNALLSLCENLLVSRAETSDMILNLGKTY